MTTAQQRAARLREMAALAYMDIDRDAMIAGAEALEQEDHSAMVAAHFARTEEINNQHCARLAEHFTRSEAIYERIARALEPKPKGRWRITSYNGQFYMIPVEHWAEWLDREPEAGEYTAIVPDWAKPVPPNVVITGWEG